MLMASVDSTAGEISVDRGIAATRTFVEKHGTSLLQVMQLAAGEAGEEIAQRLVGLFQTPGEPGRQEVVAAIRELRSTLSEVPIDVEPREPMIRENHIAELDAAVNWYMARICELAARLS